MSRRSSPPPEAAEYQVQVREKIRKEREARKSGADYTKYCLQLGQEDLPREPERWAILRTFRYLVESGIPPETVARHCGPRASRAQMSVDGEVGHDEFIRLATTSCAELGECLDPIRWFCDDDELLSTDGRTYAFSSQSVGTDWLEARANLRDAFPEFGIAFTPAG